MKSVSIVDRSMMSAEFLDARSNLRSVFKALRQLNDRPSNDPEVIALLDRRHNVRAEMQNIRRRDKCNLARYILTIRILCLPVSS